MKGTFSYPVLVQKLKAPAPSHNQIYSVNRTRPPFRGLPARGISSPFSRRGTAGRARLSLRLVPCDHKFAPSLPVTNPLVAAPFQSLRQPPSPPSLFFAIAPVW